MRLSATLILVALGMGLGCSGSAAAVQAAGVQLVSAPAAPRWRTITVPAGGEADSAPGESWRGVALAAPAPRRSLIPIERSAAGLAATATAPSATAASATAASATAPSSASLSESRQPADAQAVAAARIQPPYLIRPSLGGGVPTGYVGGWGDYYIAGSAGTPGKQRGGSPDGSINLGFGLGDPVRSLGLEVNWGIGSIKNLNANGSVGLAAGRILVNRPDLQVAVSGGLLDAYSYGNEAGQTPINGYGAVTMALPLRRNDPAFKQVLQLSAGTGGSSFSAIDANFNTSTSGFFMAAGVEVLPNVGVSVGQSSRSTNINLSFIPFRTLPIFVNLLAADLFDSTPFGTVGVLSIGWGDSLRSGFFGN